MHHAFLMNGLYICVFRLKHELLVFGEQNTFFEDMGSPWLHEDDVKADEFNLA